MSGQELLEYVKREDKIKAELNLKKDVDDYGIGRLLKENEPGYKYLKDSKLIGKMLSAVVYDVKLDKKITEGLGIRSNDSDTSDFNEEDYYVKESEAKTAELVDENGEKMRFRGIDKYIVHKLNQTIFAEDKEAAGAQKKGQVEKEEKVGGGGASKSKGRGVAKYEMKPVLFR